jgi:putative exosortase-associated protein (TIGR04073 family)
MGLVAGLLAVLIGLGAGGVSAEEAIPGTHTAGDKLGRGLANVFLSFLEIPRNIHNTTQESSVLQGWTVGTGKGLGYMAMRIGVGLYEIVTFPFPLPKDYAPVIEPEYVWQEPGPRLK